jgi:apolipoprotein N-acyltransferase
VVFEGDGGTRLASPICYEGILPALCRSFEDLDLFVNVTNDAWFGETSASDLHGMLVAIRATELGIPVFRSAYSGISFVADPHGRIHHETALFEEVNRVVPVRLARVSTWYGRFGDWFVLLCALALAAMWQRARRG